ncbi:unnamed protein product [Bemisia tabaci]|uniref:Cuticular protein n=1 Tax=Bemisia tabaci TaxID=7038 RepID=A0A9P0C9L7_BEMTA|nr:unnamed protein product [Bemisia tabaci]
MKTVVVSFVLAILSVTSGRVVTEQSDSANKLTSFDLQPGVRLLPEEQPESSVQKKAPVDIPFPPLPSNSESELTNTAAEETDSSPESSNRTRQDRLPRSHHGQSYYTGSEQVVVQEPVYVYDKFHYPSHVVQEQVSYSAPAVQKEFVTTTHVQEPVLVNQATKIQYPSHVVQEQVSYATPAVQKELIAGTHYTRPSYAVQHLGSGGVAPCFGGGGFGGGVVTAVRPPRIIVRESVPPTVSYAEQAPIVLEQPAPVPFVFGRTQPVRLAHHSKPFYIEHFETPVIVDHFQKPVVVNHKQAPVVIDHYQEPQVLEDQLPGPLVQTADGPCDDVGVDVITPVGPSIGYLDAHPAHSSVTVYEPYPSVVKEEVVTTTNLVHAHHPVASCD